MNKFYIAKFLSQFLPPIISQKIRNWIITVKEAEDLELDFERKVFTGGTFKGNTKDFHAFKLAIHGFFDWRNIVLAKKILKIKNGDIIEVGANIGTETISFADFNKNNLIHSFEPVPLNFKCLVEIKKLNNFDNLHLYEKIVSDTTGRIDFKIPTKNDSGSGHIALERNEETIEIDMVSLDRELIDIQSCSSIIIDVEGHEYSVLKGAKNIINKFRPFIILEVNGNYLEKRANISVDFLYKEIENMNYDSYYIDSLGIKKVDIEKFRIKTNKNWICIPKENENCYKKLSNAVLYNAIKPFF
ncbi:FkbM family methyltransferase [Flavobacterium sp. 3-218]